MLPKKCWVYLLPIVATSLALTFACKERSYHKSAESMAISDAKSFTTIAPGVYRVTCFNGTTETHPLEVIQAAFNNPNDQKVCPAPGASGQNNQSPTSQPWQGISSSTNPPFRCLAKDSDERAPWLVATVEAGVVSMWGANTFLSKTECDLVVSELNQNRNYLCMSKDFDNRGPYVLIRSRPTGPTIVTGLKPFNKREVCQNLLASFKEYNISAGKIFLACSSADQDDRAPWIIFQFDPAAGNIAQYSRNMKQFRTLEECQKLLNL